MVLYTENFKYHRSLKQRIHKGEYEIRVDSAFESVMRHCANTPREGQHGTWITEEIIRCYTALHHEGIAHSIESWHENILVGGLYGICIGHMFFGESMFSHRTDSSKVALFHLVKRLSEHGLNMIDCQQETKHLKSLGAAPISRETFKAAIAERINRATPLNLWQ
jgi:leucyl/phenylalanyl-tRNA--protein transferase